MNRAPKSLAANLKDGGPLARPVGTEDLIRQSAIHICVKVVRRYVTNRPSYVKLRVTSFL